MASPANTPIQQRYVAGDCALDVVAQPLALSRWYSQPVVQDLQFQLWLRDEVGEFVLIAEGDRTTLRSISDYVSQQVQTSLVMSQLGTSSTRTSTAQTPLRPEALRNIQPIGYLQLCDLASVLSQYEQTVQTLPAAIALPNSISNAVLETSQAKTNVVPITRTQRTAVANVRSSRRQRRMMWASSAAVALFTVGLAGVLRPGYRPEPQVAATRPEQSASPNFGLGDTELDSSDSVPSPFEDFSEKEPLEDEPSENRAVEPVPPGKVGDRAAPSSGSIDLPLPGEDIFSEPSDRKVSTNDLERVEVPSDSTDETVLHSTEERSTEERSAEERDRTVFNSAPPSAPSADQRSPDQINLPAPTTSEGLARIESFDFPVAAESEPDRSESANVGPGESMARANTQSNGPNRASDSLDLSQLEPSPSDALEAEVSRSARTPVASLATQVQGYFQRQWQMIGAQTSTPLRYDVQISASGNIVSLVGLDEAAQSYRERLLPSDSSVPQPQFSTDGTAAQIQIEVLPSGQVQIID